MPMTCTGGRARCSNSYTTVRFTMLATLFPIPFRQAPPSQALNLCASSAFYVSALNSHPSNCNPIRSHSNISELFFSVLNHLQIFPPDSPKSFRYPQGGTGFSLSTRTSHRNPMSTLRQIEANQRNAQKSTGPTSVTGKATSSMNALKTGIDAKSLVLPSENRAHLDQLIDDYYSHHQPASPDARAFVDDLIYCEWTLRRLRAAETQAWRYQSDNKYSDPQKYPLGQSATSNPNSFSKLQYRLDATRRARQRALDALAKLKAEAAAAPTPAPDPAPPPPASPRSPRQTQARSPRPPPPRPRPSPARRTRRSPFAKPL